MYDDLARTQQRSFLEQLVVHCVIPSLLASFVMQCRALNPRNDGLQYTVETICTLNWSGHMRGLSSVASVTIHAALGAAVLFGTARSDTSNPTPSRLHAVVFPEPVGPHSESSSGPRAPQIPADPDLPFIPLPSTVLQTGALSRPVFPAELPSNATTGNGHPSGRWAHALDEAGPEVLTGPLPVYPELLRRAGVQGQVLLQAVVDTTGRVEPASIFVVFATNPSFVAPARHALLATLFRPARVGGRAVAMLVRVPFDFTIRGSTGLAR